MGRIAKASAEPPRPDLQGLDMYDLMRSLSPDLLRPTHLGDVVDAFQGIRPGPNRKERRARKGQRIAIAAPVQHGKSTCEQHFIVGCLLDDPGYRIAMCGYGQDFVKPQSKITREIARTAGVQFKDDEDTIYRWGTTDGGFAMFTTVNGALTGFGFDCILIDDPFKDRAEVERAEKREDVWTWYTQTVLPRIAPWTDIVIIASRWHIDDLTGRLLKRDMGYREVWLPAIKADGTALWPEVRPLDFLQEQRKAMGDYAFSGNYLGRPYLDADTDLTNPARYHEPPDYPGFRYVIGFDMAYTQAKHSDYFAYCVLKVYGTQVYVVELKRMKSDLRRLAETLKTASKHYGNAPCVSYVAGPEVGMIQYLTGEGVRAMGIPARYNKRVRAQALVDKWKHREILFPMSAPWLDCLERFELFRGHEEDQSDEVDAVVSALALAAGFSGGAPRAFGQPRI